ncbi:MAG: hypothetical protein IJF92_05730 [Bacilli bacterium]|nr:hypothetical protein [Bacilli bacterium]
MAKEYVDYEEAATDIKAVIFDIVDNEKKTTYKLKEQMSQEVDENKNNKINELLSKKEEKLEEILSNIDIIVKDIESLNNINIKNNLMVKDSEDEESFDIENSLSDNLNSDSNTDVKIDNDSGSIESEEDIVLNIDSDDNSTESEKNIEESVALENNELEESIDISEEVEDNGSEAEESTNSEEDVENSEASTEINNSESNSDILYAFNKDTKIAPKAIMVKKDDQFLKLKNSCEKQLEKLQTTGIFDDYDYEVSTANTLKGDVIDKDIEEELKLEETKYDDVERFIEDLTVKASIYTNEGEMEKANAINKKIAELKANNT